jgi:hypothetical protein
MSSLARWQNFSCSNYDRLAWLIDFSLTMLGCTTMIPIREFPFLKMAQNAYPGSSYSSILCFLFQTRQIALKFIKSGASRLTLYRRNPVTIILVTCNHRVKRGREDLGTAGESGALEAIASVVPKPSKLERSTPLLGAIPWA